MDWADGGDMQHLLQQHAKAGTRLPEGQLLAYFVQLVAALAHIHGAGVIHRDLKTSNIFLTSQGLLKLGDFGIAKVCTGVLTNFAACQSVSCNTCVHRFSRFAAAAYQWYTGWVVSAATELHTVAQRSILGWGHLMPHGCLEHWSQHTRRVCNTGNLSQLKADCV